MVSAVSKMKLKDILNDEQVHHIMSQALGREGCKIVSGDIIPMTGFCGFLGDHFKAIMTVKVDDQEKKIQVFIKSVPLNNKPKADYINDLKFFKREMCALKLFAEIGEPDGLSPWCTKALFSNKSIIVMPDLSAQSYKLCPKLKSLDLPHALVAVATLARFHAACVNYQTKISHQTGIDYTFSEAFEGDLTEYLYKDTPWIHSAAKVSANLLNVFSNKYNCIPDLSSKLTTLFLEGCETLTEYPDTLNVLIHRDLWVNNIMFRYNIGRPIDAIFIDFQCVRYAPPAFDVTSLLYLNTTRSFRDQHEVDLYKYYYSIFTDKVDSFTKQRLKDLNYDEDDFLKWCQKSRMFALIQTIAQLPGTLMDQKVAQQNFGDPESFERYNEDRSEPVLAHCLDSTVYRDMQLQVSEEFVERYVR